jgi:hypothetical protein
MGVDAGHGVRSPYDSIESHPQAFYVYRYISTSILNGMKDTRYMGTTTEASLRRTMTECT